MAPSYKVAPIVETVVEFRLDDGIDFDRINKSKRKFTKNYPSEEEIQDITTEFSPSGASVKTKKTGFRVRTHDQLQVLTLTEQNFAVAQLAPYPGWDKFLPRIQRDWGVFRSEFGPRRINRIGLRTINRIDTGAPRAEVSDYLHINLGQPVLEGLEAEAFTAQITFRLPDGVHQATTTAGLVNSPVPDTIAFILDIDVFTTVDIPMRDDNLWSRLEDVRKVKNAIFEASITDRSRETFS
nr:TIGR04255 family protein [uncultured Shinella sp.]